MDDPLEPRSGDPRAEALLYLKWSRHSAGRHLWRDPAAPRTLAPRGAKGAKTAGEAVGSPGNAAPLLEEVAARVRACQRCRLAETRTHAVPGEGSPAPVLMVIGEAPGADEDASGRPFVGRAGQLLTRMLAAIGLSRDQVFIGNTLKCRPPENRPPEPDESAACKPYLVEQMALLAPPLILALGNHAVRALLDTDRGITSLRGRFQKSPEGWKVMPSFHPAYLLRNPAAKKEAWEDLQKVARELGLRLPTPE